MCPACLRVAGGARAERWKFSRSPSSPTRDARPPMTSSPIPVARSQYLLDLLAQVPDPRKKRGRRHALAGLLAVGIAAVIAGSRSFAAIGQWAADAGPEVLAVLGATRGPAEESTFRRAFALVSADVLDRVTGAWLWTRAMQSGGRLVIAIDGKTVRGAKTLPRHCASRRRRTRGDPEEHRGPDRAPAGRSFGVDDLRGSKRTLRRRERALRDHLPRHHARRRRARVKRSHPGAARLGADT